jgi:hypothetical protein
MPDALAHSVLHSRHHFPPNISATDSIIMRFALSIAALASVCAIFVAETKCYYKTQQFAADFYIIASGVPSKSSTPQVPIFKLGDVDAAALHLAVPLVIVLQLDHLVVREAGGCLHHP